MPEALNIREIEKAANLYTKFISGRGLETLLAVDEIRMIIIEKFSMDSATVNLFRQKMN